MIWCLAALVAFVGAGGGCSSQGSASVDAGRTSTGASAGNAGVGEQISGAASGGVGGHISSEANGGAGGQVGAPGGGISGQVGMAAGGAPANTFGGGTGGHSEGTGGTTDYCSGSGGAAWTSASGGTAGGAGEHGGLCCREPPSCLAESVCGNGVRDACTAPSGADPCPVYSFAEECDGNDLEGATCTSLGFGSGQLACTSGCRIDRRACYTCVAGAPPPVSRCNAVAAPVVTFPSIAANDDGTAIVWVEETVDGPMQVAFSLLSPGLDVLYSGHIAAATFTPTLQGAMPSARVAALPSGWVVMVSFGDQMTLYTLNRAGELTATNTLDSKSGGLEVYPFIVSQPAGGPMVIWGTLDIYAAFVSADGLAVTAPMKVSAGLQTVGGIPPGVTSAAFAAGKFQAVVLGNCDFVTACVEIVSLASDGSSTVAFPAPGVDGPWGALLVSGADDLRLYAGANCGTTNAIDPCLLYERLTPAGTVVSGPTVLNHVSANLLPIAAVASADDSYLSFDAVAWSSTLVHAGLDGAFVGGPRVIATGGSDEAVMVRQGANLVAAWIANGPPVRIEVALLAP